MQFKIDTKEKIVVLRLEEPALDAKMSEELLREADGLPELAEKNLILDLGSVQSVAPEGLKAIFTVYSRQYDRGLSAAVAHLNSDLTAELAAQYPEMLNVVPTLSEAIDMVMMEDLERELNMDEE
ncbi:hypothetical protein EGT74_02685 [Chitinophaga lutea]|uniref:STAS domain-containing protein n=1 Tax=Chitinophaga lutea TaxID=2488634 RepID=A0A3N4Q8X4_9BACT|nr:hypothetical protein [Chitinophaga lutea]RPE12477.1 hypothetical protein EGT74_02685 [Chitinophaga lutea]